MKLHVSFRLRIALLSASLAGTALVGFGFVSWWLISNAKVGLLDAKLENQLMGTGRYQGQWQAYETTLARELEISTDTPVAISVVGRDGDTLYRSSNWSADLDVNLVSVRSRMPQPPPPPPEDWRLRPPPNFPPPKPRITSQLTKTGTWRVGAIAFPPHQVAIAVNLKGIWGFAHSSVATHIPHPRVSHSIIT
jgi:two-component system, OmpR family, heavy metal sensor histidine kinase CusS